MEDPTGGLMLCTDTVAPAIEGARPSCIGVSIGLQGVTATQANLVGSIVQVQGTWLDGVINVSTVKVAGVGPRPLPTAPCSPPIGGWPGNGTPLDAERDSQALESHILRNPDAYAGFWAADVGNGEGVAFVVATTLERAAVEAELRELVDGNLCVVTVERSQRELEALAEGLDRVHWTVTIDEPHNRVVVRVPWVDGEVVAAATGPDAEGIHVDPLVHRE
jgi:hypothetical protein